MDNQIRDLQRQLSQYEQALSVKEKDLRLLNARIEETNEKLAGQETENASLKRLVERSNVENDQLLEKLGRSEDKAAELNKELAFVKEALTESTMARDDVIDKLKSVSFETRELIDKCNKSYEENERCKNTTIELEEEIRVLKNLKNTLRAENETLRFELDNRNVEIKSLRLKSESFNSRSQDNDFWRDDISIVNSQLQNIEHQIKTIIENSQNSKIEKRILKQEIERLKSLYLGLQEQSGIKDELISKQNIEFREVKTTVDKYYSEILRLDSELKDCHKRVATLNENLEAISSENPDVIQFMHFKRSLTRFGNVENMENLLSKLLVLQEIEEFFEKNLSPHVESTNNQEIDSNSSIVTDKKQDTINRIKSYLEKALSAIEKLNEKMIRIRNEYENKLRVRTSEISTLREVLSNAVLYNKILEQTLQQYKDNVQLDKTIGTETDELLIVNETLLDGFDILKQMHRISEQSNSFLYAKFEQLKFFTKLAELYVSRSFEETDESRIVIHKQKLSEVFVLMRNVFEEINVNEPSAQKLVECQQVIEKCEKSLITKDYLKNTVENMSQEVKRLTRKVEHEMAEKIREIEALKGDVDNLKTDNCDLVCKIKNCNREIVSLSTENYDLNEKLESLTKIENQCKILKRELETIKGRMLPSDISDQSSESTDEKLENLQHACSSLKIENINIRCDVEKFVEDNKCYLNQAQKVFCAFGSDVTKQNENIFIEEKRCDTGNGLENHCSSVMNLKEIVEDKSNLLCPKEMLKTSLISLKDTCSILKKENEDLKVGLTMFIKVASNDVISGLHSTLKQLLENRGGPINHDDGYKNCVETSIKNIANLSDDVYTSNKSIRNTCEEMATEFSKQMQIVTSEIQRSVWTTFENIQSSFSISNDEMIKEMQEMNSELKKRGENISTLTQSLTSATKDNEHVLQQIAMKENLISELTAKLADQVRQLENVQTELSNTESENSAVVEQKIEQIKNLTTELEDAINQIRLKDDLIVTLKGDIQKQREMHDGDVSSVGTISRTEETSRLKDVEDTFEERYLKLKIIALKMKKNIADLNQELKTERAEKTTLQTKLVALAKQAKMSQALQEECDKLNDDLELKINEIKELKKIIQASDEESKGIKGQVDDLRRKIESSEESVVALQKEKSDLESKIKSMANQLEAINKEKLAEEIIKKEKDKEVQQLKQKLKESEELNEKVNNELDRAKKEIRKQGALTLEMRDFEKTISDLRTNVEDKETVLKEMRAKLASTVDANESLAETVKKLEEQLSSYAKSNKSADTQILTLNKTISEQENNLKDREIKLKQIIQQLESEKSTNETLLSELANSTGEMKALKDSFREKEISLNARVQSFNAKLLDAQNSLGRKENEFSELRNDYEAYKVRAHNLVQKMKNENNVNRNDEQLRKEIDPLYQTINDLRKCLESSTAELDNQKAQFAQMESTKENLQKRLKELMTSLSEKSEEVKAVRAEHRAYKLNADTLINCCKTEIDNLKASLEETKIELEKESMKTEKAITNNSPTPTKVPPNVKTMCNGCDENETVSDPPSAHHDSELEDIDEGKIGKRRKHSLVPLEQLLHPAKPQSEQELLNHENESELRANVKSLEEQVNYLTRILNESENNAARNEQQVAFLKEEIRRLQRVFDREPHLRNTEYLKNVLMKFVTLPVGEEKSQLITVLETMLKLTQNEKQTLSVIAKGQKLDQKATSSWASYLGW